MVIVAVVVVVLVMTTKVMTNVMTVAEMRGQWGDGGDDDDDFERNLHCLVYNTIQNGDRLSLSRTHSKQYDPNSIYTKNNSPFQIVLQQNLPAG